MLPDAHHRTFLSTFCDQLQASGAVVKAGGSRAILDAHTFNALVTNMNSGNAVDYCPLTAFTTPRHHGAHPQLRLRHPQRPDDRAFAGHGHAGHGQRGDRFFTTELAAAAGGDVGGTVPATLSLTLGPAPNLGAFIPGVPGTYTATGRRP